MGLRKLVLNGNDGTIANFFPNKTTIKENELECMRKFDWLAKVDLIV